MAWGPITQKEASSRPNNPPPPPKSALIAQTKTSIFGCDSLKNNHNRRNLNLYDCFGGEDITMCKLESPGKNENKLTSSEAKFCFIKTRNSLAVPKISNGIESLVSMDEKVAQV